MFVVSCETGVSRCDRQHLESFIPRVETRGYYKPAPLFLTSLRSKKEH